jgi:hypothetical protein
MIEFFIVVYGFQIASACMLICMHISDKDWIENPFMGKKKNIMILFVPLSFLYYFYKNIISKIPSWWKTLK